MPSNEKDLTNGNYRRVWDWISYMRNDGTSWESLNNYLVSDYQSFLQNMIILHRWPEDVSKEDYLKICSELIRIENNQSFGFICDSQQQINNFSPSISPDSAWQCYKQTLRDNHFNVDTIQSMENVTSKILSKLSNNTFNIEDPCNVVKGLVVGNVQSGKTANMEALMAMSADYGWNMFIILSGTIDNLRKQTQDRIQNDFNKNRGAISWHRIDRPEEGENNTPANLYLNNNNRYFTVCLKNATRLNRLIKWLQSDQNSIRNMKILIIDDEADQAGINTANIDEGEITRINNLISNLVNQKTWNGYEMRIKYGAMNYVGYTATPYANILNDPRRESLYPKNFISTLPVSKQYFGPQQIFGNEDLGYKGLSIVNDISDDDILNISNIQREGSLCLPNSLKESVLWFICCTACLRFKKSKKPVSMLIHTSQKTDHHDKISNAIIRWFSNLSKEEVLGKCKDVWEKETSLFDFGKLKDQYQDYLIEENTMKKYPAFDDIKDEILIMLGNDNTIYSHILLNEDREIAYSSKIHICIDNCKNNVPKQTEDDGTYYHLRLIYPKENDYDGYAPAFLVIGGATLSRGLTIEGLVSTYFLRSVNFADSLMQMGRWFGYRRGYELLPRLWLTNNAVSQFKYLSNMDYELRETIKEMEEEAKKPSEYAVKVLLPEMNIIRIVNNNKMQAAIQRYDYSGTYKQTYKFDDNKEEMRKNIDSLYALLNNLEDPIRTDSALVWRNIEVDRILCFLEGYSFSSTMSECKNLVRWIKSDSVKRVLNKWNVVLAGNKKYSDNLGCFDYKGYSINKVNRSKKVERRDNGIIDIGTLRNPLDILADIDLEDETNRSLISEINSAESKDAKRIRRKSTEKYKPQLLIYIISKNSVPEDGVDGRVALGTDEDLIGLSINIPEQNKSTVDVNPNDYIQIDLDAFSDVDIGD